LTKAFDAAAPKSAIPLKAVKIEKEWSRLYCLLNYSNYVLVVV
jgi:hypothetical protein